MKVPVDLRDIRAAFGTVRGATDDDDRLSNAIAMPSLVWHHGNVPTVGTFPQRVLSWLLSRTSQRMLV